MIIMIGHQQHFFACEVVQFAKMSTKVKSVVDEKTLLLTNGFIRECQKLLSSKRSYFNIPQSIIEICILYCSLREEFILFGDKMEVIDNGQTIKMNSGDCWNTAFCKIMIDISKNSNMIYEWMLVKKASIVCAGIMSTNNADKITNGTCWDGCSGNKDKYFYGYHSAGWSMQNGSENWNTKCKFNGIFTIRLNCKEKTLELYDGVYDKSLKPVKYDNIEASKVYNLAVCISGNGTVEIEDFVIYDAS